MAQGTATISATVGGTSGSTVLTVTAPALVSIAVSPHLPSITFYVAQSLQFAATGTYTNGSTRDLTSSVTWTSGTPATATIAAATGLATSVAEGRTVISATAGSVSGATTLMVTTDATRTGSTSAQGSLLIFPRIQVTPGVDTLVTLFNDSHFRVDVRCYYHVSDRAPTPSTTPPAAESNHFSDFAVTLTPSQPTSWSAATGRGLGGLAMAPPFSPFPDASTRTVGALTCFAVTRDGTRALNANVLSGSAAIVTTAGQAWEYSAWAFDALVGTGASTPGGPVDPPPVDVGGVWTGFLALNGGSTVTADGVVTERGAYAACPNSLVTTFTPPGAPAVVGPPVPGGTGAGPLNVTLVACTQDLTEVATSIVTKYNYTFWNEDEVMLTGTYECGTSWYETSLPATATGGQAGMPQAQYRMLQTQTATMRIDSHGSSLCLGSQQVGFVGVISQAGAGGGNTRGRNMIGRGRANRDDVIYFEPAPPLSHSDGTSVSRCRGAGKGGAPSPFRKAPASRAPARSRDPRSRRPR